MAKYIFVVGGVISGTGKGVAAASIGLLLRLRGHNITLVKFDPYYNINAGILGPANMASVFFVMMEQKQIWILVITKELQG